MAAYHKFRVPFSIPKLEINLSATRSRLIRNEISVDSQPKSRFYIMVAISTAIAAFGLVKNSTAIVIGAMLVAPLMMPIFGISLALINGNSRLFGQAFRAETIGVLLAIFISILIGMLIPDLEVTPEMIDRTSPNLLDLLVALLAGFAGAYAMLDEKISPVLPGVAIATSIVPPLANCGLCISLGAYSGAIGSFLLFFANVLSILLISSILFSIGGLTRNFGRTQRHSKIKRFGITTMGFAVISLFLSYELVDMVQKKRFDLKVNSILQEELAALPTIDMKKVVYKNTEEKVFILAHVYSSNEISPTRVKEIETNVAGKLKLPVELFIRSSLTYDVSALGSVNNITTESLEGFSLQRTPNPKIRTIKIAEQAIREFLSPMIGIVPGEVNLIEHQKQQMIACTIIGLRALQPDEIKLLETNIQIRTGNFELFLITRHVQVDVYDRTGKTAFEWFNMNDLSKKQDKTFDHLENFFKIEFKSGPHYLENFDFTLREDVYHVMLELVGPRLYTQEETIKLKERLVQNLNKKVRLYVRSRPEVFVTEDGTASFDVFKQDFRKKFRKKHTRDFEKILNNMW